MAGKDTMRNFFKWHADLMDEAVWFWGFSYYQIMWIAFAKGTVLGFVAGKMI